MKIFVTVGTDHHPFSRLFQWLSCAMDRGVLDHTWSVSAQTGFTPVPDQRIEAIRFMPFSELTERMQLADLVIAHASSVAMLACRFGRVPIVVPREKRFGEDVDDHQLWFAKKVKGRVPLRIAVDEQQFMEELKHPTSTSTALGELEVNSAAAVERFRVEFERLTSGQ